MPSKFVQELGQNILSTKVLVCLGMHGKIVVLLVVPSISLGG